MRKWHKIQLLFTDYDAGYKKVLQDISIGHKDIKFQTLNLSVSYDDMTIFVKISSEHIIFECVFKTS